MFQRLQRRPHRAAPSLRHRLQLQALDERCVMNNTTAYIATDLVADQAGVAGLTDTNLVNPWGLAINPSGAFWVSANGADLSTIYLGDVNASAVTKFPLQVHIPGE